MFAIFFIAELHSHPRVPVQLGTIQMSTGTHALVLQARGIEDLPKGMRRLLETSSIFKCAVNIGMDASMLRERCVSLDRPIPCSAPAFVPQCFSCPLFSWFSAVLV